MNYKHKYSNIKYVRIDHQGALQARKAGFELSEGDYIIQFDLDDLVAPTTIENLYNMITWTGADMLMFFNYASFKDGEAIDIISHRPIVTKDEVSVTDGLTMLKYAVGNLDGQHTVLWNKLASGDVYKNIEYPIDKHCDDVYIATQLYLNLSKIAFVYKNMYLYRRHNQGTSQGLKLHFWKDEIGLLVYRLKSVSSICDVQTAFRLWTFTIIKTFGRYHQACTSGDEQLVETMRNVVDLVLLELTEMFSNHKYKEVITHE